MSRLMKHWVFFLCFSLFLSWFSVFVCFLHPRLIYSTPNIAYELFCLSLFLETSWKPHTTLLNNPIVHQREVLCLSGIKEISALLSLTSSTGQRRYCLMKEMSEEDCLPLLQSDLSTLLGKCDEKWEEKVRRIPWQIFAIISVSESVSSNNIFSPVFISFMCEVFKLYSSRSISAPVTSWFPPEDPFCSKEFTVNREAQ